MEGLGFKIWIFQLCWVLTVVSSPSPLKPSSASPQASHVPAYLCWLWGFSNLQRPFPMCAAVKPNNGTTGNELLGLMSFPKPADRLRLDFSSLLGPLFYTWVVQLLLPTM